MAKLMARSTFYKGIKMRSRLEAGHAQFLDEGIAAGRPLESWTYEPCAYASEQGQYLPDFQLHWKEKTAPAFCEVKPAGADAGAALRRMHIILATEPNASLLVIVGTWKHDSYEWVVAKACSLWYPCGDCGRPT